MEVSKYSKSYFEDLLEQIDDYENKRIKSQLMELLTNTIKRYSLNSSVSKEIGQMLMDNNIYIISYYLKHQEKAIEVLKNNSINTLFIRANKYMIKNMHILNNKVDELLNKLVDIKLLVYHDTLFIGLKEFIKNYNYQFNASDNILTYDYPTYIPLSKKIGIERFIEYIYKIRIENEFIIIFKELINEMLLYYQRDYYYLVFNVTKLLLKQLISKYIVSSDLNYLYLNEAEIVRLKEVFIGNDISIVVNQAFNDIVSDYYLNSILSNYLLKGLDEIISELKSNSFEIELCVKK